MFGPVIVIRGDELIAPSGPAMTTLSSSVLPLITPTSPIFPTATATSPTVPTQTINPEADDNQNSLSVESKVGIVAGCLGGAALVFTAAFFLGQISYARRLRAKNNKFQVAKRAPVEMSTRTRSNIYEADQPLQVVEVVVNTVPVEIDGKEVMGYF